MMARNSQFNRLLVALGLSVLVNIVWLTLDALSDPQKNPYSKTSKIAGLLGTPGATFADWVAPSGHDVGPVLVGILIAIVSSIVFYTAAAWIILSLLSLPAWWRERQQPTTE